MCNKMSQKDPLSTLQYPSKRQKAMVKLLIYRHSLTTVDIQSVKAVLLEI